MKSKKETEKVIKDIEYFTEKYDGVRFKKSFGDIFEQYTLGNEQEQKITKEELYSFVNDHFDEINAEFTLRINELDVYNNNEIPLDCEGPFVQFMITLCKELKDIRSNDGIGIVISMPCEDCIITKLFIIIAKYWNKYNENKMVKFYSRVNEYVFREIPMIDDIWYG